MNRVSKRLGVVFVIASGLGGVTASSVVAQDHYRAASAPTVMTGSQEGPIVVNTDGGDVTCTSGQFRGTQGVVLSNDLTLTPLFSGCTRDGGITTDVDSNGCSVTLTTPSGGPTDFVAENPHLLCPEGQLTRLTPTVFGSSVCTVTVPPQTPTEGFTLIQNVGSGNTKELTITLGIAGLHYMVDGGGGLCGPTGGTTTNGEVDGSILVKGFNDSNDANDQTHNNVREPIEVLNT